MAKVGEGDERWIVKEREDGTNVNGWHWKETNLTGWSQSRLKELLGPACGRGASGRPGRAGSGIVGAASAFRLLSRAGSVGRERPRVPVAKVELSKLGKSNTLCSTPAPQIW